VTERLRFNNLLPENGSNSEEQEFSCCWDGHAMLHKSNLRFSIWSTSL